MLSKKLDEEVKPFEPVSKNHARVNKNGVNLEQLQSI